VQYDEVIIRKSELWLRGIVWPRGLSLAIMINKICGLWCVCTTDPIWTKTPSVRSQASHMFRSQVLSLCFSIQLVLMSIYLLRIAKLIQWVCFDHNTMYSLHLSSISWVSLIVRYSCIIILCVYFVSNIPFHITNSNVYHRLHLPTSHYIAEFLDMSRLC